MMITVLDALLAVYWTYQHAMMNKDTEEGQSDEVSCEDIDDIMDVMFGHEEEPVQEVQSPTEISPTPVMLHWENGREREGEPVEKMEEIPSSVKPEYAHLFREPIDAVFAILPYIFWELMVSEINRYAQQFLRTRNRTKISGYQWSPVTITEVITYFGLLIFAMLYPQIGRRFCSAWNNPSLHPWTKLMTNNEEIG
jgi:hypothetical protein